jgi:uncharacterized protein HemX
MIQLYSHDSEMESVTRIGSQPIALAAVLLLLIVTGIGSMALWRASAESVTEADRATLTRQLQARTTRTSEQLMEKTRGLEATQQESIDQLQVVQDELQTVKQQLASQQADNRRLADQVATLSDAIEGLRQSYASAPPEASTPPVTRNRSVRMRAHAMMHRRHSRARG